MNKRIGYISSAILGMLLLAGFYSGADSTLLGINRSLQIFGEVFRQVSSSYVDEIDPIEFIEAGINGMLNYLDPYTTYIPETQSDELELLTNGRYGGFGITVDNDGPYTIIVGLAEGFTADRAGIRIGDVLIGIDSVSIIGMSSQELRKYTRGKAGTSAYLTLLRGNNPDTIKVRVEREDITIKNVSYSGFLESNIGYIKLERFSRTAATEVRNALNDLRQQGKLEGLILDLRDNPGGLLESAIGVTEMFVPEKTLVVSTKGRTSDSERLFYSRAIPLEPDIPLAVLINGKSASASEIVAGAVQDIDRGLLVGERSFGKGLVQTISPLPFNATLKMTTARYYTPSGRCIQKIDYAQFRSTENKQTTRPDTFQTRNGRSVPEANGITPDTMVFAVSDKPLIRSLQEHNLIFKFATNYCASREGLHEDFKVTPSILKDFYSFIEQSNAPIGDSILLETRKLRERTEASGTATAIAKQLAQLEDKMLKEQKRVILKGEQELEHILRSEIIRRFMPQSQFIAFSLQTDKQVLAAKDILKNKKTYADLIAGAFPQHE